MISVLEAAQLLETQFQVLEVGIILVGLEGLSKYLDLATCWYSFPKKPITMTTAQVYTQVSWILHLYFQALMLLEV